MAAMEEGKDVVIEGVIWQNPGRMSGRPCFYGSRVPIDSLWDYLEGGETLDRFLAGFPGVTREQAVKVMELARKGLAERFEAA